MPYSAQHKENSRRHILESARKLFSTNGFSNVTIDEVMADCSLTRGAFYAHFSSKSELYNEALAYSAINNALTEKRPHDMTLQAWLSKLLDEYLSIDHVKGVKSCPLTFLSSDISATNLATKHLYTETYKKMNQAIQQLAEQLTVGNTNLAYSLTAMLIGAVAIARTLDDENMAKDVLSACRCQVKQMLNGI